MKLLFLLPVLIAGNAFGQYTVGKRGDFWNLHRADQVCLNQGKDSLTLVRPEGNIILPRDSVNYLTYRERKSWFPYLLTAGIVGGSAYSALLLFGRDDGMYTAEGKARFVGILSGGLILLWGSLLKEQIETKFLIHPTLGIDRAGTLIVCDF